MSDVKHYLYLPKYNQAFNMYDDKDADRLGVDPSAIGAVLTATTDLIDQFHIGEFSSKNRVAKPLECRLCGGTTFNVGVDDFYTAIRCINCKWELSIHEG